MSNKFLYNIFWNKTLSWWNYVKQLSIVAIISLFLPTIISFLSFNSIWYSEILIIFLLQVYILVPRINDINQQPIYAIILLLIIHGILWYFHLSIISRGLLLLLSFIPSSKDSYFKSYAVDMQNTIAQNPWIWNNINNEVEITEKKWNSSELLKTFLLWLSTWIWLSLLSATIWFYIFYKIFWINLWWVITIISTFSSIWYWFNICKKGLITYTNELQIDAKKITSSLFWHIFASFFIEIILILWFILSFWQREWYMIALICFWILFLIGIIHISMIWYRLWIYFIPLLKSNDPSFIDNAPFFIKYKLKTIETPKDTIFNHIYIPAIIFITLLILAILAINWVFW